MFKKTIHVFAVLLLLASVASAALLVTDSGVSTGNENRIGERKSSWDASQTNEWVAAWFKIPPGSDQENGAIRYRYRVTITAPDKTNVNEGPFDFPADGVVLFNKQVSFFDNIKTSTSPNPCQGEWRIEFTLIDAAQGNKEDLAALLPFYLTGSDTAQAPTDINVATDKAVTETSDFATLAVFNTAKQFGAQQEQQRQVAASTTTTTTIASAETKSTKEASAKKKTVKKKKKRDAPL